MDYLCGKFDDCSFSRFGFIVRTDRQTDTHTYTDRHADENLTHVTINTDILTGMFNTY